MLAEAFTMTREPLEPGSSARPALVSTPVFTCSLRWRRALGKRCRDHGRRAAGAALFRSEFETRALEASLKLKLLL